MKIHLLHGIHTREGNNTVANLKPYLERTGYEVVYHNYGNAYALLTRFQNPGRAKKLEALMGEEDIAVGHSNGCALIHRIMHDYKKLKGAVFINPALDCDVPIAPHAEWVQVYYNAGDEAVPLTEFPVLRKLFFDAPWGEMGKRGYTGNDWRVDMYDTGQSLHGCEPAFGHSAVFKTPHLDCWGEVVSRNISLKLDRRWE